MSGWFDGSGRGTSDAFYGIGAGHRGRRNAQRQRYDRGFGASTGEGLMQQPSNGGAPGPDSSIDYNGYTLNSYSTPIGWVTKVVMNGVMQTSFVNASKGATVNDSKDWVDVKVYGVDDGGWSEPVIIADPPPFVPLSMPADFVIGGRTLRASYNYQSQMYYVTMFQGTATLESTGFLQAQGQAALTKFNEWKVISEQRANYDVQESLSVDKGDYRIDLVVTQAASISGFFNGILNVFGLGTTNSSTARHTASVPQNMRRNTTNMAGKSVNLGVAEEPLDPQGYNTPPTSDWKSMPTKTFAVKVTGFGESHTAGNNGNAVVIKDTGYSTYPEAKAAYDTEVATIENNLTHYDNLIIPDESEVDPVDGNGGDTTGNGGGSDNYNEDYVDPALEQAAAAAAAAAAQAAAEQAAAQAAAEAAFLAASNASAVEQAEAQAAAEAAAEVAAAAAAAAAQQQFSEESAASAENYNAMTVDIPATYQTQTYTTTVPAATSSSSPLLDNKVLLGAGAVTLVAGAYLLSRRD